MVNILGFITYKPNGIYKAMGGVVMIYPCLLFENNESYLNWKGQYSDSCNIEKDLMRDLNINYILKEIDKIISDFPCRYITDYLKENSTAIYRLEIMKELYYNEDLRERLNKFISLIKEVSDNYVEFCKSSNELQKLILKLNYLKAYVECVNYGYLVLKNCTSKGLKTLWHMISNYEKNLEFTIISNSIVAVLPKVERLKKLNLEYNMSTETLEIKFEEQKGSIVDKIASRAKDLLGIDVSTSFSIVEPSALSNLEEKVLEILKQNYPDVFCSLLEIYNINIDIKLDELSALIEQLHFYLGYIRFVKIKEEEGHNFTIPIYELKNKIICEGAYDLSLVIKNRDNGTVVCNDIIISKENGFILTGANQGGKTTYLRTLGIVAVLANNGMLVPGTKCNISYFDNIFTHFNVSESTGFLQGKFGEEIKRFDYILSKATSNSLFIINECFASTRRIEGARTLVAYIVKLIKKNCLFGCVTHYYELYGMLNENYEGKINSFIASVDTENNERKYKIITADPSKMAYAHDIAVRCGITYEKIKEELCGEYSD